MWKIGNITTNSRRTYCYRRRQKNILTLNFESKLLPFQKNTDDTFRYLKQFIELNEEKKYLLLDEIQDLINWETMVNALMIDFNIDIYITGSNAKLLSSELSTYLAGRYIEIKIYPFSYEEVRIIRKHKILH